jgi:seryl-tRNA synthetase
MKDAASRRLKPRALRAEQRELSDQIGALNKQLGSGASPERDGLMGRVKDLNPGLQFCFTLNSTAIACPRVLISILELYQQPDGSVVVPAVLRP